MAIEGKVSFMTQAEKRLAPELTAESLRKVLSCFSDVLFRFEIREIDAEDGQDDLVDCYLNALKVQGRSQKTVDRYKFVIEKMLKEIKVPAGRVTVYHLRQYLAAMKERGIAESTMEGQRQIFSAFYNWLQRESLIEKNPTANLGAIKVPKKQRGIYSDIDIAKLNGACKSTRDRAIIAFLSSTGCRISEALGLDRESVDLEKLECIVHGKGNKERRVYMSPIAGMLIREYLNTRTDDNPALFIGLRNERLQPNGARYMLNETAKRAGVEHVHPHKFRRTLATEMARRGMPIQEVCAILGHEKIDTTMRYVSIDNEDIKNSYRRFA
ncbi:MAG: tyrosine-type recombinase/integrase [Lentisphaeria bacterium]|nr:tyrosine-type recombinase/integrase [Lentisphaeria bacterium]